MTVILPRRPMPERATELGDYVNFNEDEGEELMNLNQTQVEGIVRLLLGTASGVIGILGFMKGYDWSPVITLLTTLLIGWWSAKSNSTNAMVVAVAAAPEVKGVVMESKAAANATPDLKASANVIGPTAQEIKKL